MSNLNQKVALVTGGIGGIGSEICRALIEQGRKVYAAHLLSESEKAAEWKKEMAVSGYEVNILPVDVSSFDSCAEMVKKIEAEAGPVAILVNCAGITRDTTLRKMDPDFWRSVIDVNLNSVYNVTRQVINGMLEAGFGRIVNISSVNGQKGQFGQTNYSASKAGIHGFTMALAQETAKKGITVNSVSPGYIETSMTAAVPEDVRNAIVATIPAGRMGRPREIAHTVAFLAADDTTYITGANIPVNGGLYMSY
ncbi:MAG: acetoacetyl-CoA reductase [Gammaproteobacteria bacterium]